MSRHQLLWHYTTDRHLTEILRDGCLKPSTAHIAPHEKPITWFSTEQFWEPTVVKGWKQPDGAVVLLGMLGLLEHGVILVRIGVLPNAAPYTWPELRRLSGMPPKAAQGLLKVAKRWGAKAARWRGTFGPVPSSSWCAVQYFQDAGWSELEREVYCDENRCR